MPFHEKSGLCHMGTAYTHIRLHMGAFARKMQDGLFVSVHEIARPAGVHYIHCVSPSVRYLYQSQ